MWPLTFVITGAIPLLGSAPDTWDRYSSSIDLSSERFHCFDGSSTVPLSFINDNYLDCADGSDEPGTFLGSAPQFYCKNNGSLPRMIDRWSVGDGICDCCDGSDEATSAHSACPDVCVADESARHHLIAALTAFYNESLTLGGALIAAGSESLANFPARQRSIDRALADLESRLSSIESKIRASQERKKHFIANAARFRHLPTWKRAYLTIWQFTFWVPRRTEQEYEWEYDERYDRYTDSSTRDELAKIGDEIAARQDEKNFLQSLPKDVDVRYGALISEEFRLGAFRIGLWREFHLGETLVGRFRDFENRTMGFADGAFCRYADRYCSGDVKLVCGNESRLVRVIEIEQCYHEAVLTTPAACEPEDIERLPALTLEQLSAMAELTGKR
jgi:hypothetical protein